MKSTTINLTNFNVPFKTLGNHHGSYESKSTTCKSSSADPITPDTSYQHVFRVAGRNAKYDVHQTSYQLPSSGLAILHAPRNHSLIDASVRRANCDIGTDTTNISSNRNPTGQYSDHNYSQPPIHSPQQRTNQLGIQKHGT
jgi:hypothetical protein